MELNNNFNIVELIEKNPVTKLSQVYNSKLLSKIKDTFTSNEQQLFVASFYCYLNYNSKTDFIIDLDNIWHWIGFNQKVKAKELLEKQFIKDKDYITLSPQVNRKKNLGGFNKISYMMTTHTFKLFCIKANTKKANEIHDYFIKLEELLHELTQEETNELKLQLEQKDNFINKELNKTKELEKQTVLLREYADKSPLVYIIRV